MVYPTQLPCPRCHQWLYVGQAGATTMWGCGHCGGVWLDNQTAQRVVDTVCQVSLQLAKSASDGARARVELTPHQIHCPVCRQLMRTERMQRAWIDIDRCDAHGTWYDRGELEKIARTAHIQADDWRNAPRAPQHQPYPQQANPHAQPQDEHWDVGSEVAAEVAVEGGFLLLDILFSLAD